jgi:hypothetical protein
MNNWWLWHPGKHGAVSHIPDNSLSESESELININSWRGLDKPLLPELSQGGRNSIRRRTTVRACALYWSRPATCAVDALSLHLSYFLKYKCSVLGRYIYAGTHTCMHAYIHTYIHTIIKQINTEENWKVIFYSYFYLSSRTRYCLIDH